MNVVQRAFGCLLINANTDNGMTVSEIAEQVGIPASSTYRNLGILEERALVERTPDDKRVLGIRALQLGRQLPGRNGLQIAKVARPIMADLVNTTHETVTLTALAGLDAISVESIGGIEPILFQVPDFQDNMNAIWSGAHAPIWSG